MSSAYGDHIKEAARTLHQEGLSSREIQARLAAGNAGLAFKVEPSQRTIDKWRAQWRREGIRAGLAVREGDEEAVENAIYRQVLAIAREHMAYISEKQTKGVIEPKDVTMTDRFMKTIDAARYRRQLREESKTRKLDPRHAGYLGDVGDAGSKESMLETLARAERNRKGREGLDDSATNEVADPVSCATQTNGYEH